MRLLSPGDYKWVGGSRVGVSNGEGYKITRPHRRSLVAPSRPKSDSITTERTDGCTDGLTDGHTNTFFNESNISSDN